MRPASHPRRFDPRLLFPDFNFDADGPSPSWSFGAMPPGPGEDPDMPSLREIDDAIDLLGSGGCHDCPLCRTYAARDGGSNE
jgi:hypothetical protein